MLDTVAKEELIPKPKRFQLLQVLRAFAAFLVVTTHASLVSQRNFGGDFLPISTLRQGGVIGVETFFILSGFIHFYVHHKDFNHKKKLKPFVWKRIIRVYPIYWIITLFLIPIFFIAPSIGNKSSIDSQFTYLFKSLLLIPQEANPLLSVGWTLTFELFFYVLICVLIWFPPKVARSIIFIILMGSIIKFVADIPGGWDTKYRTGNSIFDLSFVSAFVFSRYNITFLMGGLGALILIKTKLVEMGSNKQAIKWLWLSTFLLSTILICLPHEMLGGVSTDRTGRMFYYIPPVLLWIISSIGIEVNSSIRVPSFLTYLGNASYSIFLLHYPLLLLIGKGIMFIGISKIIDFRYLMYATTFFSIVVSLIFYEKVEKTVFQYLSMKTKKFSISS